MTKAAIRRIRSALKDAMDDRDLRLQKAEITGDRPDLATLMIEVAATDIQLLLQVIDDPAPKTARK